MEVNILQVCGRRSVW